MSNPKRNNTVEVRISNQVGKGVKESLTVSKTIEHSLFFLPHRWVFPYRFTWTERRTSGIVKVVEGDVVGEILEI